MVFKGRKIALNRLSHVHGPGWPWRWSGVGHTFGECLSRLDLNWMYINIPKCASTWTKPKLQSHQFECYNYNLDNLHHKHALIVLRDPVERWLSGICEYFATRHPTMNFAGLPPEFYEVILNLVTVDTHTEKQIYFIEGLPQRNCTFLWCDRDYSEMFSQWVRNNGASNNWQNEPYHHITEACPIRSNIKRYFEPFLEDPKYIDHIKQHYKLDYELINSVQFWRG